MKYGVHQGGVRQEENCLKTHKRSILPLTLVSGFFVSYGQILKKGGDLISWLMPREYQGAVFRIFC